MLAVSAELLVVPTSGNAEVFELALTFFTVEEEAALMQASIVVLLIGRPEVAGPAAKKNGRPRPGWRLADRPGRAFKEIFKVGLFYQILALFTSPRVI